VGKGPLGNPRQRKGKQTCGRRSRKDQLVPVTSLAHLKLRTSEKLRTAKEAWHQDPRHHGTEEIPPPPPKKSRMDRARNTIARTAAQIRTGHWRSAVFLKRIRKRQDDKCWFCRGPKMTRSHVLLYCVNDRLRKAREEAWEGKNPGGIRVLLNNSRWECRLLRFLEPSGASRVVEDGTDEDQERTEKMDRWIVWEAEERMEARGDG